MPIPLRQPFRQRHYLAESLDPIHIGTGEFQLGRVDNTIVREPGTNLPKIPGSSIGGVSRAYTALAYDRYRREKDDGCAGKGGTEGDKHCGTPQCPVCTAFGFSIKSRSFQGLAQFSDARILFFPVYSAVGPVWITCPGALSAAGCAITPAAATDWFGVFADIGDKFVPVGSALPNPLNLGWLYLERFDLAHKAGVASSWNLPDGGNGKALSATPFLSPVLRSLVVVNDRLFSCIVNDQLEVRTSVSISPDTGAAEEGALFTTEAIPRACFLTFQITYWDPANFRVPVNGSGEKIAFSIDQIEEHVRAGLNMIEFLGVGGVNTRGMGRMRVFA